MTCLNSPNWGIWGKEKYTFNEEEQNAKHIKEITLLHKLIEGIPERMQLALRYSFGICNLKAYSMPISEKEFSYLSGIYNDAIEYTKEISDIGFRELVEEIYCIHKTASEIPGFTKGKLVNETKIPDTWRKYVFLDFFKFSCINILIREPINKIVEYSNELLTSKFILSYFLGTGSFVEKASVLFSNDDFQHIKKCTDNLCKKI